ncbi:MAG TPA: hypothetical protein VGP73_14945 [Thermoanaerobaculia bacterium]
MASEFKPDNLDFGVIIAFVAPGFITFQAISYHMPTAKAWMDAASNQEQSVGIFLFVLLASLALGVVISGIRALMIDKLLRTRLLRSLSVPELNLDWSKVNEAKLPILLTIRNGHYRYYQFYSNTAVALSLWALSRSVAGGPGLNCYKWGILVVTVIVLIESARGALEGYVKAVGQALTT